MTDQQKQDELEVLLRTVVAERQRENQWVIYL
jgi:hypothetical protein